MTSTLVQLTRRPALTKPRRPIPEGAVPCHRKGPLEDFIAWERCTDMRSRGTEACGACQHHVAAVAGVAFARSEDTRQRWSKQ